MLAFVAVITGAIVFWVMAVVVEVVHPFAAVTVKLYVPGKFTTGVAAVLPLTMPGPVQRYVPPPVPVN